MILIQRSINAFNIVGSLSIDRNTGIRCATSKCLIKTDIVGIRVGGGGGGVSKGGRVAKNALGKEPLR